MGEIGQVIKAYDNKVEVKMERTEACAKCRACSVGMESKEMIINAENLCGAKANDFVEIVLEEQNFLQAVLIMYGLPFISLLVGAFAGYYISLKLNLQYNEIIGFFTGLIFVVLSYLWIKSKESFWKSKNFIPKAVRVEK